MKAAVIREPGAPEVLVIEERPGPQPAAGWSLIRVKVCLGQINTTPGDFAGNVAALKKGIDAADKK